MNEILTRKYIKKVMTFGIAKSNATEIVNVSMETSKGKNVEVYISYAIDLQYGLGFSQKNRLTKD